LFEDECVACAWTSLFGSSDGTPADLHVSTNKIHIGCPIRLASPSAGAGTKGPRLHDWCYLELADLDAEQFNGANDGLWTRGLLIRRRIADDDLAFFTTWCPAGTSIETLVAVEGHRWAIEDSFETAKNEFGLDHNESRSWHGWHRHVSLVMLAFAMMAAIRYRANPPPPKKTKRRISAKTKAQPRRH
jgi:SRSO17 transposase